MTSPAPSYEQQLKARYAGILAKTRAAPTAAVKPATVHILPKQENKRTEPPMWQIADIWFDAHVFTWGESKTPNGYLRLRCFQIGVTLEKMKSHTLKRPLVGQRQILMWEIKTIFGLSFPAIGRLFGGRDHTTAMAAFRKIQKIKMESKE